MFQLFQLVNFQLVNSSTCQLVNYLSMFQRFNVSARRLRRFFERSESEELFNFSASFRFQPFHEEVVVPIRVAELRPQDGGVGGVVAHA